VSFVCMLEAQLRAAAQQQVGLLMVLPQPGPACCSAAATSSMRGVLEQVTGRRGHMKCMFACCAGREGGGTSSCCIHRVQLSCSCGHTNRLGLSMTMSVKGQPQLIGWPAAAASGGGEGSVRCGVKVHLEWLAVAVVLDLCMLQKAKGSGGGGWLGGRSLVCKPKAQLRAVGTPTSWPCCWHANQGQAQLVGWPAPAA
jgi:hypothetical protein